MSLHLIYGSMFSGKTTEIMRRVKRLQSIGLKCIVVNHAFDERVDGNFIQTHTKTQFPAIKTNNLFSLNYKNYNAIIIDEAQFFTNLCSFVRTNLKHNKYIIVVGLTGDFQATLMGSMHELIPVADEICLLKAYCKECADGTPAIFSKRLTPNKNTICIGDDKDYMAVCRKHFHSN